MDMKQKIYLLMIAITESWMFIAIVHQVPSHTETSYGHVTSDSDTETQSY